MLGVVAGAPARPAVRPARDVVALAHQDRPRHALHAVQAEPHAERVEECSEYCVGEDCADVGEEVSVVQREGRVQDDGRQEDVEEERGCEHGEGSVTGGHRQAQEAEGGHRDAEHDEEAGLGDDSREEWNAVVVYLGHNSNF